MRTLTLLGAIALLLPAAAPAQTFNVVQRTVSDEKAVFATVESISVVPARSRIGGTVMYWLP